jgi:hypothetical protein
MLFTTYSSPLFAFNPCPDTNVHFTIGKGMFNGYVHLKDLIDIKGPVLHFIYGLAWLLDKTGHTGVYIFEAIFLAASLIYAYKLSGIFIKNLSICFFIGIISSIPYFAYGTYGGLAEEFVLGILIISFYYLTLYFVKPEGHKVWHIPLLGGLFASVFLIKFNLAVFFVGFIFVIFCDALVSKKYLTLFKYILWFICGFCVVVLPYLIYTLVNHSLENFIDIYFTLSYKYSQINADPIAIRILKSFSLGVDFFRGGMFFSVFIIFGLIFVFLKTKVQYVIGYGLSLALLTVFIFIGQVFAYSTIPLCVFLLMGFIGIGVVLESKITTEKFNLLKKCFAVLLLFVVTVGRNGLTQNHLFMMTNGMPVQERMVEIIKNYASEESPSLLQTVFTDFGFYTAAGVIPEERYFTIMNFGYEALPEMFDEQLEAVKEGRNEFIIIPSNVIESNSIDDTHWQLSDHYNHITALWDKVYPEIYWHLYQRKEENMNKPGYFYNYVTNALKEDYVLMISVKDDASGMFNEEMQRALYAIGLNESLIGKYRYSYGAVIDGKNVVYENLSEEKINHTQVIDDVNIELTSSGILVGNKSSIKINSIEYSPDIRGINIVKYNKTTGKVVDAIAFDTNQFPNSPQYK